MSLGFFSSRVYRTSNMEKTEQVEVAVEKNTSSSRNVQSVHENKDVVQTETKFRNIFPSIRMRRLNFLMSIFHTTFFVLTLVLGNLKLVVPVYATNITFINNEELNREGPRFELVPSYYEYASLHLTYIVASFFFCSAFAHIGNATLWKKFYENDLSLCRVTTRWIEYFFSASIMIAVIAYNVGIREYLLLFGVVTLIASTMPFGWLTETYSRPLSATQWCQPRSTRLIFHVLGYIPQCSAWLIILLNFYGETATKAPDFVYAIVWTELALFFSFGFVQLYQIFSYPRDYYKGEIVYQFLSFGAKGLLGVILLINVLILGSYDEMFD
jgi:hypothetical protein